MRLKLLDTSPELVVQKWDQGVKLIKPEKLIHNQNGGGFQRVSDLLNLSMNIAFLNAESIIQNVNETLIKTSGYNSITDTLGKTVRIAAKKEAADFSISHDQHVVKTNKLIIEEENFTRIIDDITFQAITTKLPWYDENNKIIGVLALAVTIGAPGSLPLTESLRLLANTGIFGQNEFNTQKIIPGFSISDTYLSKRETQCLHYLLQGMSFKKIGLKLGLSNRTVGHYIDNIKGKFNVSSKEELIEIVLNSLANF